MKHSAAASIDKTDHDLSSNDARMIAHFSNEYGRIEQFDGTSVLRYKRSELSYPTLEALERSNRDTALALDRLGRERHCLLVDLREAKGSNTPQFEGAMKLGRRQLMARFAKKAALVATAAGQLQVRRHAREDASDLRVFLDEREALAFLK